MPRSINRRCQHCSSLPVEQAQILHGSEGDGCWNFDQPQLCHAKRTYYRVRSEKNAKRRAARLTQAKPSDIETIELTINVPIVAFVYLYRDNREAPLHAIGVTVWKGNQKIAEVPPIHCAGMTNSSVNEYLRRVLEVLKQKYGITQFKDQFFQHSSTCPIQPCPFRNPFIQTAGL